MKKKSSRSIKLSFFNHFNKSKLDKSNLNLSKIFKFLRQLRNIFTFGLLFYLVTIDNNNNNISCRILTYLIFSTSICIRSTHFLTQICQTKSP